MALVSRLSSRTNRLHVQVATKPYYASCDNRRFEFYLADTSLPSWAADPIQVAPWCMGVRGRKKIHAVLKGHSCWGLNSYQSGKSLPACSPLFQYGQKGGGDIASRRELAAPEISPTTLFFLPRIWTPHPLTVHVDHLASDICTSHEPSEGPSPQLIRSLARRISSVSPPTTLPTRLL